MTRKRNGSGASVGEWGKDTQLGGVCAAVGSELDQSARAVAIALEVQFVWARHMMGVGDHRPVRITGLVTFTPMMKRVNRVYSKKLWAARIYDQEVLRPEAERYWALLDGL